VVLKLLAVEAPDGYGDKKEGMFYLNIKV